MQSRETATPQTSRITPLNPNRRSEEISHRRPAIAQKTALGSTSSYMETQIATAATQTGFAEKKVRKPGMVCKR